MADTAPRERPRNEPHEGLIAGDDDAVVAERSAELERALDGDSAAQQLDPWHLTRPNATHKPGEIAAGRTVEKARPRRT